MEEKSKFLSYLLRHKPEAKNLKLDAQGWIAMQELVDKAGFTIVELQQITAADEKKRYSISDGKIRANQGHSTSQVKLKFEKAIPPPVLYHGTTASLVHTILRTGIKPMSRHHVHLSADRETAENVAGRRKKDITVLLIDTPKMLKDGVTFYKSDNGVWLVDFVEPKYIVTLGTRA